MMENLSHEVMHTVRHMKYKLHSSKCPQTQNCAQVKETENETAITIRISSVAISGIIMLTVTVLRITYPSSILTL